jgi:hexosaminidase
MIFVRKLTKSHRIPVAFLAASLAAGAISLRAAQTETPKQPGLHSQYGIDIIPEPQLVRVTEGDFTIDSATVVFPDPQLQDASPVESLQEGLAEAVHVQISKAGSSRATNVIALKLIPETALREVPQGELHKEAYSLEVTRSQIVIEAPYAAGLFYGVQTLLQLAEQGAGRVRGLKITDWPDLAFRAFHVDLWFHLDRPWYYEALFRQLARYKLNTAVFEMEDKFPFSKHPVLSAPGAMTREQVTKLIAAAKRQHIEIVPLVQTLGHVAFVAKHPEFYSLREVPMSNWQLCPLKPGTFPLIQDMLDDVMDLVQPARYFHIGGDEARELGMGDDCRQKWGDKAAVESFKMWLGFVCDYLKKRGKTAIVWDDMFLRHFSPADLAKLPDNLVFMRWDYSTGEFRARDRKVLDLGYPVWIATAAQTMTPIFPDQRLRVFNNANFIPNGVALGSKGIMNTAWEDAGVHPETYWIGFVCSAEYAWTSKKPGTEEFLGKFFPLFYGKNQQGMSKAYDILSAKGFIRAENSWTKQFEALDLPPLPDAGFRVNGDWAAKHAQLVAQAKEMRPRYAEAIEIITRNLAGEAKNRYNLEVTLLCARTMLHFTDLILGINEINENLLAADADHQKKDDQAAIHRYQRIGRIVDDLRYEKSQIFDETVRVWEKSTYPKDFRHIPGGRDRFVHQIDRDFYYGNKTMDLSYIFEVEEQLGLFGFQQKLYRVTVDILRGKTPW